MMRGPEIKNEQAELHRFRLRLAIGGAVVFLMFCGLFSRFFFLQVMQHEHYQTQAENNRISIVPVAPNRGLIVDRNGSVLAHNYSAYTLEITPGKVRNVDKLIGGLSAIVDISARDRKRFKKLLEESQDFESLPIRTKLNDTEVARFVANRYRFPEIELKARAFRHYPKAELVSHVVGYIGRINDKDQAQLEANGQAPNYRGSLHLGKLGLEQSYEKALHGTAGFERVEIDAGGRIVRALSRTPPVSGSNLVLSLDIRLQEIVEQAFGDRRGAFVAIEPATGEVLAFLSKPGYDGNLFVDGIDSQNWEALSTSLDRPLSNRALQGTYPPGSTFKPFMALAGLDLGKRTPQTTISDPGFFTLPGHSHRYRDWKLTGHGSVDLHKSLVISCDTYYYGLANELGVDAINSYIGQFGFGKKTGIDVEGEATGILPSTEWKQKRHKQKWFAGDTISVGIGQGYNIATPLQLAHATAVIANNGKAMRPHFVRQIQALGADQPADVEPVTLNTITFKPDNLRRVQAAMVDVTRTGGTAAKAGANAEYVFAGKTGTAQVVAIKQNEKYDESKVAERHRDHAWFIAYAPAENPKIAVAVLVENGGHGGSTAGPIARIAFDYYLLGKRPEITGIAPEDDDEAQSD